VSRHPRQFNRYLAEAEKLGKVLREARIEAGMTQIEVAGVSGVPYSTLRAIERAHVSEPSFFAVMDICRAIGLKLTKLEELSGRRGSRTTRTRGVGQVHKANPGSKRALAATTNSGGADDVKLLD
jgi:transcriptional regulator with XRE-family HTH domain